MVKVVPGGTTDSLAGLFADFAFDLACKVSVTLLNDLNVHGHFAMVGIVDPCDVTYERPVVVCNADPCVTGVDVALMAGLKEGAVPTVLSSYPGEGDAAA